MVKNALRGSKMQEWFSRLPKTRNKTMSKEKPSWTDLMSSLELLKQLKEDVMLAQIRTPNTIDWSASLEVVDALTKRLEKGE